MRQAGYFLLLSSALHLVGFALAGFASDSLFLLFPALLYVLLFAGLARGMLWVAWIAFICMMGGIAGTIVEIMGASAVPAWILWGVLGADFVAAGLLFSAIWAGSKAARTAV